MTKLTIRQRNEAYSYLEVVRLHAIAVQNYLFEKDTIPSASDDGDALARLNYMIKNAEEARSLLIKANESVTKS